MLSRGCWPCLVAIAAAASFGPAVAQNPYETANLRARVLSEFDRDQDGELSMLELRNATVRAVADRAAALQSLAQGTLETEASASIWDAEAMSRLAIGHAGRWLSAQESLPVMGENGLVSDASLMRELTPWEQTGGLELLNEGTALSSGATAPAETPWWLRHPLTADPAVVEAQPNGTPATPWNPSATPVLVLPTQPSFTRPYIVLTGPGASPAANTTLTADLAAQTTPGLGAVPQPSAGLANSAGLHTLQSSAKQPPVASITNLNAGKPRYQLGSTKVVGVEAPKAAAAVAPQQRVERPAMARAGALGPMRIVPPSPSRAGILSTRPAGNSVKPLSKRP